MEVITSITRQEDLNDVGNSAIGVLLKKMQLYSCVVNVLLFYKEKKTTRTCSLIKCSEKHQSIYLHIHE